MSTIPGARLFHDGQLSGRRIHVPVFLGRAPEEQPDADLRAFYQRLLPAVAELRGDWRLCETEHPNLLAWAWDEHLIVVNLGATGAQGVVHAPWSGRRHAHRPPVRRDLLPRGEELFVILAGLGRALLPLDKRLARRVCTRG